MMKKLCLLLGLAVLVFGGFGCSKKKLEYLFVLYAGQGQVNPETANSGTLVMNDAAKNVFFFSDRPNRKAGKAAMQEFLNNWSKGPNSFKVDHPNAALVGMVSSKDQPFTEIPVLVYAPEYNAANDQLTFKFKTFDDTHKLDQQSLGEVVLFLDAGSSCEHYICPFCPIDCMSFAAPCPLGSSGHWYLELWRRAIGILKLGN